MRGVALLLLLFKLVGLATFSMKKQTIARKNCSKSVFSLVTSKWGIFYNSLLSFLIVAANYAMVPALYQEEYLHRSAITTIIDVFQGVLGTFVIAIILMYYGTHQSAFVRIGNRLFHVEGVLSRLQQPLDRKQVSRLLLAIYVFNLTLWVVLCITQDIAFNFAPITWLGDIVPGTFVCLFFTQYFSVLVFMEQSFVSINVTLQSFCRGWGDHVSSDSWQQFRRVFVSCSTAHLLVRAREIHDHLCDVSNEISQFYSLPSLVALSFTFSSLLYNTYYLFVPFMFENVRFDGMVLTNTMLWIVYLLLPLGLLTSKATKVTNEIEKTGNIVHAVLNRTIGGETKRELEQFSLQLLHRKVKFTANGYYTLNNQFFQSMLATVTTYMVILIQFQMGSPPVQNEHACNCTQ